MDTPQTRTITAADLAQAALHGTWLGRTEVSLDGETWHPYSMVNPSVLPPEMPVFTRRPPS